MTTRAPLNGTGAAEMEFEASHYSTPEMEEEWEVHEGSPHSNPYSNPEMEYEADRFIPLIAKAATKLLPHAVRLGRGLFRRLGRGSSQQPGSRASASGRS